MTASTETNACDSPNIKKKSDSLKSTNIEEDIPSSAETPRFCSRISKEKAEAESKRTTHNELLRMGSLMQETKDKTDTVYSTSGAINKEIFSIKTMTLPELYEYVENKLSKDHYSPEVIYLLFKIQSLLLEKQNLTKHISNNETTIIDMKKELLEEKIHVGDLNDSIKESTNDLDNMEKETTTEIVRLTTEVEKLNKVNKTLTTQKAQYEYMLCYFVPFTISIIAIFVNYSINYISSFISNI